MNFFTHVRFYMPHTHAFAHTCTISHAHEFAHTFTILHATYTRICSHMYDFTCCIHTYLLTHVRFYMLHTHVFAHTCTISHVKDAVCLLCIGRNFKLSYFARSGPERAFGDVFIKLRVWCRECHIRAYEGLKRILALVWSKLAYFCLRYSDSEL